MYVSLDSALFNCRFAKVKPSCAFPLLCFVFEQWLELRNDVCILVCLMLTCAERHGHNSVELSVTFTSNLFFFFIKIKISNKHYSGIL